MLSSCSTCCLVPVKWHVTSTQRRHGHRWREHYGEWFMEMVGEGKKKSERIIHCAISSLASLITGGDLLNYHWITIRKNISLSSLSTRLCNADRSHVKSSIREIGPLIFYSQVIIRNALRRWFFSIASREKEEKNNWIALGVERTKRHRR